MANLNSNVSNLGSIGFGCLQLEALGQEKEAEAVEIIVKAFEIGIRLFDTAACYGAERHNEKLLGKAIKKISQLKGENTFCLFSTKCGINFGAIQTESKGYEGSPQQIRESVKMSLKTLELPQLPLLYLHRINPEASKAEWQASFRTLKELVEEGKVRYLGLSEPTEEQIAIADEVFKQTKVDYNPFLFVQSACSMATQRAFRNGVFAACQKRGIHFVSYTASVRGLVDERLSQQLSLDTLAKLTPDEIIETIRKIWDSPVGDFRFFVGFFSPEVIKTNVECLVRFQLLAKKWGYPPSQLALAWQKAKGMIPIPGTTKIEHLRSNVEAMKIQLSAANIKEIEDCFIKFQGNPNPPGMLDNTSLEV